MAFGGDFEADTINSSSKHIKCHQHLIRRSSSKDRYVWEDEMKFTEKQEQYLAFIYCYTKIHGRPPAERDMQMYFRVTYPSIHQMVLTLEKNGLISRTPRQTRSIQLLVPKEEIPQLD